MIIKFINFLLNVKSILKKSRILIICITSVKFAKLKMKKKIKK